MEIKADKYDEWKARASAAEARLEELTRERDEAVSFAQEYKATVFGLVTDLRKIQARLKEAKAVLEPFAAVAPTFSFAIAQDGIDDGLAVIARVHVRPELEVVLSTTNFSDARAFLHQGGSE